MADSAPPPPPSALDPVLIFQNYLYWLIRERDREQRQQQEQQEQEQLEQSDREPLPDNDPTEQVSHNLDRDTVAKQKQRRGHASLPPPRSQSEIDQILQVVDTLFGSVGRGGNNQQSSLSSSSSSSSLVEGALCILDAAETNITRVVSLSSRRSMYLVRSSSTSSNKNTSYRHRNHDNQQQALQQQDSKRQQQAEQPQVSTSTSTATMTTPLLPSIPCATSSPLYNFCFLPDTSVSAQDFSLNDSLLFYCSCPYHFDQTCRRQSSQSSSSSETRSTTKDHYDQQDSNSGTIVCKHLLALLLVPALGIQTALLELPNDHQFGELIMGRIGL